MSYTVERLSDEPIIIVTWQGTFSKNEFVEICEEINALIGAEESVARIDDVRELEIDFGDIVVGMGAARAKAPGSPSDPRINPMLVGSGMLWDLVSSGLQQLQYGGLDVPLFTSMDEAIKQARRKLG